MSIYSFKTIGTTASNYPHRFNFFSLFLRFSVLDLIKSGTNRKLFISAQFATDDCTIIVVCSLLDHIRKISIHAQLSHFNQH